MKKAVLHKHCNIDLENKRMDVYYSIFCSTLVSTRGCGRMRKMQNLYILFNRSHAHVIPSNK